MSDRSATSPPPKLITRRLESGDFHKGFLELLAQLSVVGALSRDQVLMHLCSIK
jgi:hypothetical protein